MSSTTVKYRSVTFIWMVTLYDLIHRLKGWNHLIQQNKQYHRKELLNIFHLNGHTFEFHPQTQQLEPRDMNWCLILIGMKSLTEYLSEGLKDWTLEWQSYKLKSLWANHITINFSLLKWSQFWLPVH